MSQSRHDTLVSQGKDECYDYSRLDDLSLETLLEVEELVDPFEYALGLKPSDSVVEGQNDESEITSQQGGATIPTQDTPKAPSYIPLFPSPSPEPTTDGDELEGATPATPATFSPSFEFDDNALREEHDDKNDDGTPTSSTSTDEGLASTDTKGKGRESADVTEVLDRSPKRMRRTKSGSLSIYAKDVLPAEPLVNIDDLKENEVIVREIQAQDVSNDHALRKRKLSDTNGEAAESYDYSAAFSQWIPTPFVAAEEQHSASVDQTQYSAPLQRVIKPLPTRTQVSPHYYQSHGDMDIAMMPDLGEASAPGDHQLYAAYQHHQGYFIQGGDHSPRFPSAAPYNGQQFAQAPAPGYYNAMPVPSNIAQYAGGSFPNNGPIQAMLLPPVQFGITLQHPSFEQHNDNAQPILPADDNTVAAVPRRPRSRVYSNQYAFFIQTAPVQCRWRWRNEHGEWRSCTVMVTDVDDLWDHLWATHTVEKDERRIRCQMGTCADKLTWLNDNRNFDKHINSKEHSGFDRQKCRHCSGKCARPDMYHLRHKPCIAAIDNMAAQGTGSN
ncbi:hypothetical protein VNI00_007646 [Paramarasmius palmivorus]|uniref:C2H2-type domain-containing protein n=1 Tax=Paramarasmius palmivorus TaxID=297713 RepID=A0AAW0D483_9AGAR